MSLFGEVCGVSRKASSNNEPTEVSRSHSSLTLKARGERRRAECNKQIYNYHFLVRFSYHFIQLKTLYFYT